MGTSTMLVNGHKDLVFAGPLGSLDAYISKVVQVPVLGQAEELALARRFRDEDDLDAARQLVLSQLRFVVHIARGVTFRFKRRRRHRGDGPRRGYVRAAFLAPAFGAR